LRHAEYYAQPQNAFWRIMGDLFGAGPQHRYEIRLELLKQQRVAVWDVCASARRRGSLDSAIDRKSLVVNDFAGFFDTHPRIEVVACNGATAAALYSRVVPATLRGPAADLQVLRLPSTSPAHAAMTYAEKLAAWAALPALLVEPATA
jgi:hypoxanthine-DNA glycosylase